MTHISPLSQSVIGALSNICQKGFQQVGEWKGKVVRLIKQIPVKMHQGSPFAKGVLATANLIAFTAASLAADHLVERFDAPSRSLSLKKKRIINVSTVAGTVAIFNILFARATGYPLSLLGLALLTGLAAVARFTIDAIKEKQVQSSASSKVSKQQTADRPTANGESTQQVNARERSATFAAPTAPSSKKSKKKQEEAQKVVERAQAQNPNKVNLVSVPTQGIGGSITPVAYKKGPKTSRSAISMLAETPPHRP